jgi:hypothetical protein
MFSFLIRKFFHKNFFFLRARRAARENQQSSDIVQPIKPHYEVRKFIKIGRPGYKGKFHFFSNLFLFLLF